MATIPLLSATALADRLGEPGLRVVDCRFTLGQPGAGRERYLAGHLPGAAFLDLDTDLTGDGGRGRHPLPSPGAFTASARRAGISGSSFVVAYDDGMTGGAARLWWLLRHFRHDDVSVLDGGLEAWNGPLRAGDETVVPGDFTARPRTGDTVDAGDVLAHLDDGARILLDARAPERYRGEVEPLDPVAGHIPGARNAPFTDPLPPDLAEADGELVAYCGSGVTATVLLLRLAAAGRPDAKLYPGSWSDWSTRGLPAERGPHPSGRGQVEP